MDEKSDTYNDIINLSRPKSKKHPAMSIYDRAAQFAPFSALSGYGDAIDETARHTDSCTELCEDEKEVLREKLRLIEENIDLKTELAVTYFVPDVKKEGGAYVTVKGRVKKFDEYERHMLMSDGTAIPFDSIIDIEGSLFGGEYI